MNNVQKKFEDLVAKAGCLPAMIANKQAWLAVPYKYRQQLYNRCAEFEGVTAVSATQYANCFRDPQSNINNLLDGERYSEERWRVRVRAMMLALVDIYNQILTDMEQDMTEQTQRLELSTTCADIAERELKYYRSEIELSKRQLSVRKERKAGIETILQNDYLNQLTTNDNE